MRRIRKIDYTCAFFMHPIEIIAKAKQDIDDAWRAVFALCERIVACTYRA